MAIENFRIPETPESRTPRVLVLLVIMGLIGETVRAIVDSRYSVGVLLMLAVAAVSYAIWRYLRQQSAHPQQTVDPPSKV